MPGVQKTILLGLIGVVLLFIATYFFAYAGINTTIKEEIQSKKSVVLLFSASWCGSCNKQKPILYKVLDKHKDIQFFEIGSNLNKVRKRILFKDYNVQGIPTLLFFKEGKEIQRLVGLQNREALEEAFSNLD